MGVFWDKYRILASHTILSENFVLSNGSIGWLPVHSTGEGDIIYALKGFKYVLLLQVYGPGYSVVGSCKEGVGGGIGDFHSEEFFSKRLKES
jgi:hypothetical protein